MLDSTGPGGTATLESFFFFALGLVNSVALILIFLALFLAFLAIEALYDWILKIPFREHMDWRLLVPYVALYVSSSYGFVVMVWKESMPRGILMLALAVVQIVANARTHPRG